MPVMPGPRLQEEEAEHNPPDIQLRFETSSCDERYENPRSPGEASLGNDRATGRHFDP